MAFTSAILGRTIASNKSITWGTFTTSSTEAGGDIDTGLHMCEMLIPVIGGGTVATNAPVVNETFPVAGNAVSIVTDASADGMWVAIGDYY